LLSDLGAEQFSLAARLAEAAALSSSLGANSINGIGGETIFFKAHEREAHFLLLQQSDGAWSPCAQVFLNDTAAIIDEPRWTCCEEPSFLTLWQIALVIVTALLLILAIGAGAVALKRHFWKQKMSKGPYKVILTPADFVFPQVGDNRRVSTKLFDKSFNPTSGPYSPIFFQCWKYNYYGVFVF
jgi:hypothetical protein